MQSRSWTEVKRLSLQELQEGECIRVTGDDRMAFYLIVKPQQVMETRVQGICSQIDASRGF